MLRSGAAVRAPVRAATVTCPLLTGISVPSHCVNETRGKVFKLDLQHKETQRGSPLVGPAATQLGHRRRLVEFEDARLTQADAQCGYIPH